MGAKGVTHDELLAEIAAFVLRDGQRPGDGWFSTQEIFDKAQASQPDITLAVVYNNLRRRAEKGNIQRTRVGAIAYWKLG